MWTRFQGVPGHAHGLRGILMGLSWPFDRLDRIGPPFRYRRPFWATIRSCGQELSFARSPAGHYGASAEWPVALGGITSSEFGLSA